MQSTGADFKGCNFINNQSSLENAESTRRKAEAPAVSNQAGLFIKEGDMDYREFVGKVFAVQGFNGPRIVEIYDTYYLGGKKRYPAFACKSDKGDRENFLCRDVVKDGQLVKLIRVLAA